MARPHDGARHVAHGGRRLEHPALLDHTACEHFALPWEGAEAARRRHAEEHLRVVAVRVVEETRVLAHDHALGVLGRVGLG